MNCGCGAQSIKVTFVKIQQQYPRPETAALLTRDDSKYLTDEGFHGNVSEQNELVRFKTSDAFSLDFVE